MKLAVLEVKCCVNDAAACETPCMSASEQRVLDIGTKGTLSQTDMIRQRAQCAASKGGSNLDQ
jgi:hypothetical protein